MNTDIKINDISKQSTTTKPVKKHQNGSGFSTVLKNLNNPTATSQQSSELTALMKINETCELISLLHTIFPSYTQPVRQITDNDIQQLENKYYNNSQVLNKLKILKKRLKLGVNPPSSVEFGNTNMNFNQNNSQQNQKHDNQKGKKSNTDNSFVKSSYSDWKITTVYHAGDFSSKAEDLKKSYPGRGTGFFGTGYYFTTTPEKCASQGEDRPIYSFSIEGLNLFYGTIDTHEKLKDICDIISFWPWLSVDMKNWWNLLYSYEKIFPYFDSSYNKVKFGDYLKSNYEYMKGEHPDWYNTFTDYFGDDFNEKNFIERCNNIPELQLLATQLKSAEPDFELINSVTDESGYLDKRWYNEIHENLFKINTVCYAFCDEDKFKNICQTIYEDLKEYYNDNILSRWNIESGLDSITTRFLKALGYEGVYPDPECDNTRYGGVVFEMPKDIKQVGEAKDYIHNNRKFNMEEDKLQKLNEYSNNPLKMGSDLVDGMMKKLLKKKVKSSRNIFSNTFGIETGYSLSEIATYLAAFFFDMRNLHLNTTGDSFYTYHELTQNLYEKIEDFYDDIAETAVNSGELIPMMNENLPSDWNSYNVTDCSTAGTKSAIASELQVVMNVLNNVKEGYPSMVYSKIDSMSEYFDKELFKIKQALKSSRNVFSKLIKSRYEGVEKYFAETNPWLKVYEDLNLHQYESTGNTVRKWCENHDMDELIALQERFEYARKNSPWHKDYYDEGSEVLKKAIKMIKEMENV